MSMTQQREADYREGNTFTAESRAARRAKKREVFAARDADIDKSHEDCTFEEAIDRVRGAIKGAPMGALLHVSDMAVAVRQRVSRVRAVMNHLHNVGEVKRRTKRVFAKQ